VGFEAQELLDGVALLLPRGRDIPACAPSSAELIVAAQDLKNAGYRIALSGAGERKKSAALSLLSAISSLPMPSLTAR